MASSVAQQGTYAVDYSATTGYSSSTVNVTDRQTIVAHLITLKKVVEIKSIVTNKSNEVASSTTVNNTLDDYLVRIVMASDDYLSHSFRLKWLPEYIDFITANEVE